MEHARVSLVLHRPSSAENIGAVARVLKNFGLSRLVIVAPPSWEGPARSGPGLAREDVLARARRTARHASDLLDTAAVHRDLRSALAGSTWSCGTTSRAPEGRPRLTPRELAAEVARRALAGPVAIVLGEERRGLSDGELELCQAVCTIPTRPEYDSMNLAQAAAVLAYEVSLASGVALPEAPEGPHRLCCTCAPVHDYTGREVARVGLFAHRSEDGVLSTDFHRACRELARQISVRLGHLPAAMVSVSA